MKLYFTLTFVPTAAVSAFFLYKYHLGVPKYTGDEDLKGKVAIITGGSSGIGQEIAYRLAIRNATLILACRNVSECHKKREEISSKSGNKNLFCSKLDLESSHSINNFVKRVSDKFQKVDILVNNAGYKGSKSLELTNELVERQLAINTVGPYLLTKGLIPLLSASESARVLYLICPEYVNGSINKNDINSMEKYNKYRAFNQSQLMRLLSMKYFSDKFLSSKITFNACDPGPTYSGFHARASYNISFYQHIYKYLNKLILRNVTVAAETPVMCCVSDELNGVTGMLYRDLKQIEIDSNILDPALVTYVISVCDELTSSNLKLQIK